MFGDLRVLLLILLYLVLFAFVSSVIVLVVRSMFRAAMHSRLGSLWRVEAKINLLLEHAGIEFHPYKSLPQEVADAGTRVEAKINLLLEHAGIEFDPYKSLPQEAADAIGRGEKIRAIEIWRSATGASLKEAKDFIEEVQRRIAVTKRG
jgi:hypothetical protein